MVCKITELTSIKQKERKQISRKIFKGIFFVFKMGSAGKAAASTWYSRKSVSMPC